MAQHRRDTLAGLLLIGAATGTLSAAPPATATPAKASNLNAAWDLCAAAVSRQEARRNIPRGLMQAISRVESGQWNNRRRAKLAWPWTIHADGKGRYLATKSAATAEIRRLQRRGIRNIDVGCMQVNLMHHPTAFRSVALALDPDQNAAYAADFLISLKRAHGSWRAAVQRYHSTTPARQKPYLAKVYAEWRKSVTPPTRTAGRRALQRAARKIDRAHKLKLTGYRKRARSSGLRSRTRGQTRRRPAGFLATWPPRSVKAQRRAQNLARAWAHQRRK